MAQGSNYARDRAHAPLFSYVNEDKLKSIETYARELRPESSIPLSSVTSLLLTVCILSLLVVSDFINLLDNYETSTGVSEQVTSEELMENRLFINAIMETDLMKVQ